MKAACHQAPPHSSLATAGALASINLADSWLGDSAVDGTRAAPHAAAIDLADGYYQFSVPEVASWFSLGVRRRAVDAGVSRTYCDDAKIETEVDPEEWLWACFGGLPMGWSWGLYFCHEALSECCRRAMRTVQPTGELLGDRRPAPRLSSTTGFFAPYVDNGNIIAGSATVAATLLAAVQSEMATLGFVFHEVVEPTTKLDLLGRTLDLEMRTLRPTRRRMWRRLKNSRGALIRLHQSLFRRSARARRPDRP